MAYSFFQHLQSAVRGGDNFRYIPFLFPTVKPALREYTYDVIVSFIRETVDGSGAGGVILGLSGGIDSALVMKLCCDALGSGRVEAVLLPATDGVSTDEKDAGEYAASLGVRIHRFPIKRDVSAIADAVGASDAKVLGNIKARVRMVYLYANANMRNLRVAGTGNKSELLTGYFTKFGDGAVDFLPLGDIYKTEVRQLAARLRLPEVFLVKPPSAGLWEGQTDEDELGIAYEQLDRILFAMENGLSAVETARETGLEAGLVDRVFSMVESSGHKRAMAPIPRIGIRTVGVDW